ncbi:hypothetical protein GGX14DRAFT_402921 [Mycena pura]|uniref:Uncharacterized protein n=1 Tax=Mycena pura TaxID=153505 RepID=A0AAD6UZJ4_9AGAR|nr:hypothetical protein GGX14DRAFT_402921 [Mycena pura]
MLPWRLLPALSRSARAAGGVAQESGAAVAVWPRENRGGSKPAQGPIFAGENDEAQTETVVENEDRDSDEDADTDDGVAEVEETVHTTMLLRWFRCLLGRRPHYNDAFRYAPAAGEALFADADDAWAVCVARDGVPVRGAHIFAEGGQHPVWLRTTDVDGSYETLLVYVDAGDAHMHARGARAPPANIVLQEPPVCCLSAFMTSQALRTVVGPVPRYSIGGIVRV